ncbi:MAG: ClpX C4-type zinc finger protein [Luteolibacter sp.]
MHNSALFPICDFPAFAYAKLGIASTEGSSLPPIPWPALPISRCARSAERATPRSKNSIAGPGVYICNECIEVCSNILES